MKKHCLLVRGIALALLLSFSLPSFSQESDFGLWNSIELKKKLKHGLALSLEEDYRLRDQWQTTDKSQTTIDLSWKPWKFLKAGAGYTFILNYRDPNNTHETRYWETRHRGFLYVNGSCDLGRFEFSLREKLQETYRVGIVQDKDKANPIGVLRSKLTVSYNVKGLPLNPYVSGELFLSLNEPDGISNPPSKMMLTEGRFTAGLEYDITKKFGISLGYLLATYTDWDDDVWDIYGNKTGGYVGGMEHVITTGLSYTF